MLRVGQKVVCVDASGTGGVWCLKLNATYTVARSNEMFGTPMVDLLEAAHSNNEYGAFYASRFRPLIQRSTETGMAILRKVADDASKRKNLVSLSHSDDRVQDGDSGTGA